MSPHKSPLTTRRTIILILALITGAILIFIIKNSVEKPVPPKFGVTPAGIHIPEEVYTYTGKVESVERGQLRLRVSTNNNYLTEDAILRVAFNSDTLFKRRILQNNLPASLVYAPPKEAVISYKDIKIGDEAVVISKKNARDKETIWADIIRVVESE